MFDVIGWFEWLIDSFFNLGKKVFDGIQDFFQDIFFWVIRQFMEFGLYMAGLVDEAMPDIDLDAAWLTLGNDFLSIAGYLGLHQAMTILVSAYGIRFFLNFMPFTK